MEELSRRMVMVNFQLPEEAISALGRSPAEMAGELRLASAVHWYSRGLISQARAAQIAGLDRTDFILALDRERVDAQALNQSVGQRRSSLCRQCKDFLSQLSRKNGHAESLRWPFPAGKATRVLRLVEPPPQDHQGGLCGHRGVRLGITYPEITEMQVRAILEAPGELLKAGKKAEPEVMIPVTCNVTEIQDQKVIVDRMYKEVLASLGMKEIPSRAVVYRGRRSNHFCLSKPRG